MSDERKKLYWAVKELPDGEITDALANKIVANVIAAGYGDVAKARAALEFYEIPVHWERNRGPDPRSEIEKDRGLYARTILRALAQQKEPGDGK